jgi:CRISPR type III-A/MTUBE-associated RAMP protein Csm3
MDIKIIKGEIELVTGLHIGAGNSEVHIGGIDSEVVKDAYGNPYIPGSSLKGKIRCLLELTEDLKNCGAPSNIDKNPGSLIPWIFGDTKHMTRILFRDAPLSKESLQRVQDLMILPTEEKSENSIDRIKGTASNPRNIERVIPGMKFDFEAVVRVMPGDDEAEFKRTILNGFALLEKDALGGSGSRGYGKIKFNNLTWNGETIEKLEYRK